LQAGWGDDEGEAGALNPHYDADWYTSYSSATRKNLARLDENRIDYDLLDDLVSYLAASSDDGAILIFLPGVNPFPRLSEIGGFR
jgi:ATP-dependent RNA helicase DHX29